MNARHKDYKFIKKGFFTSMRKFEEQLNDYANKGFVVVSITNDSGNMYALIAKVIER